MTNEERSRLVAELEAREQALLARVAELSAYVRSLKEPTFRDYSGTDYDTCAWCGQPVEAYPHADDCLWLKRIDVLVRATLEGRTQE